MIPLSLIEHFKESTEEVIWLLENQKVSYVYDKTLDIAMLELEYIIKDIREAIEESNEDSNSSG